MYICTHTLYVHYYIYYIHIPLYPSECKDVHSSKNVKKKKNSLSSPQVHFCAPENFLLKSTNKDSPASSLWWSDRFHPGRGRRHALCPGGSRLWGFYFCRCDFQRTYLDVFPILRNSRWHRKIYWTRSHSWPTSISSHGLAKFSVPHGLWDRELWGLRSPARWWSETGAQEGGSTWRLREAAPGEGSKGSPETADTVSNQKAAQTQGGWHGNIPQGWRSSDHDTSLWTKEGREGGREGLRRGEMRQNLKTQTPNNTMKVNLKRN